MEFSWNPRTIHWYQRANEYNSFYKRIADLIAPKLQGYSTLCDIGCGLGLIDLELCRSIDKITCIDISPEAINALNKSIEAAKITNIETRLMDCEKIKESWDVILISFFGSRHLEKFLPHCKKLFAVVNGNNHSPLYPEKYKKYHKNTVSQAKKNLDQKGIPYSLTEIFLEFGQPLDSLEDARQFILSYSPQNDPKDLAEFLSRNLKETGDLEYPFFLPHSKIIGIFEIEGNLKS